MDYTIIARQVNLTTVIYVIDVARLDEGESTKHWCSRLLDPISEACRTSFPDILEKFIQRVFITYSIVSSIDAFELIMFQKRMDQVDFTKHQQTALHILRNVMFFKGIAVIEHDDLFLVMLFSRMNLICQRSTTRMSKQKL